jgi:RNA polymerase sigma-70 factor (ECF subfamily)
MEPATLIAFRRRDEHAVRAIYREYARAVYGVALRVLRRADLAEDATQQTFVRAWQAAERLDLERDPAPWLKTIARRVAIDVHRQESGAAMRAQLVAVGESQPDLDVVWAVRRAIDQLPADEAAVVRLHHLEGLTYREIAGRLDIPEGTVKSRSNRAHQQLRVLLHALRPTRLTA